MAIADTTPKPVDLNLKDGAQYTLATAWVLAFAASLSVLFIGEVMGQAPCVLCWYQRAAMFPLAIILGVAVWRADLAVWRYALPIAGAGLLVAAYHSLLYYGVVPEGIVPCGTGPSCTDSEMSVMGLAIPVLSLASFVALVAFMLRIRKGDAR